jgi:hypothetical protein
LANIIAFGHRRRMGKDNSVSFCSRILRTQWQWEKPADIRTASFAKALKDFCYQAYGWAGLMLGEYYEMSDNAHLKETILPIIGKSPRDIWIEVGNHLREVYAYTWIDLVLNTNKQCDVLLISDLRYPNEAERIKASGGTLIKINRPGVEYHNDVADTALADFNQWDHIIDNDGSLNDLNQKLKDLLKVIL